EKDVDSSFAVGHRTDATAAARSRLLTEDGLLIGEGGTVIGRSGDPDPPSRLAAGRVLRVGMPGDVDIASLIGRHRPAAIQRRGFVHQVALGFKLSSTRTGPSVKHRTRAERVLRQGLVRPVPRDVNPTVAPERDLTASDGANRNCTA